MMQRNERDLLPVWLKYYGGLFGYKNLWVVDDDSDDSVVLDGLREAETRGVHVVRLPGRAGVDSKGEILSQLRSEHLFRYDFVIPADCDEYLCFIHAGKATTNNRKIVLELWRLKLKHAEVFRISHQIMNVPGTSLGYFESAKKGFLPRGSKVQIDVGHHFPENQQERDSRLGFVHFRHRPFASLLRFARAKLEDRVESFHLEVLQSHREKGWGGRHLVKYFFMSRQEYYGSFPTPSSDLRDLLRIESVPFSKIPEEQDEIIAAAKDAVNLFYVSKHFVGTPRELDALRLELRECKSLIEFGAGGSTLLAIQAEPRKIVSCETDPEYLQKLRLNATVEAAETMGRLQLVHLDVGLTRQWGRPLEVPNREQMMKVFEPIRVNSDADTVFIDGRFRVAVAAKSYLYLKDDAKVIIHDFERPYYQAVLEFLTLEKQVDRLAVLRKIPNRQSQAEAIFDHYWSDPR